MGPFVIDGMSSEFVRTEGSLLVAYRKKVRKRVFITV